MVRCENKVVKNELFDNIKAELQLLSLEEIVENGFVVLKSKFPKEWCDDLINTIDSEANKKGVEKHYHNSEVRIWKMADKSEHANGFKNISNLVCEAIGWKYRVRTILGIRNLPVKKESDHKKRWHADSFGRQIKVFCFLNDVECGNGEFHIIPNTNSVKFKLLNSFSGAKYFNFFKIFREGFRAYKAFDDDFIEQLLHKEQFFLKKLDVSKGTVVVCDTSSIHRASVCEYGNRYALTAYIY